MSEISQRYDRASSAFADRVAAVPDDGWDADTPCVGWTARDVVRHVVDGHGMFLGFIGREPPSAAPVETAPDAAFDAVRRAVLARLQDPETATQTYEGHFGVRTFEWAVDSFLSFDLVVHGWDLARATGGDETIDPEEIPRLLAAVEEWGDMARAPGVFGPPLDTPPGADDQTRLLAVLGRDGRASAPREGSPPRR